MGAIRAVAATLLPISMLGVLALLGGCQSAQAVSNHRLMEHQAAVDFTGLESTQVFDDLKVVAAPRGWTDPVIDTTLIYTHEQWRSPTHHTGVGVAYLHLPIPLPAGMVVWLARQEYGEHASDGKVTSEWTDAIGRDWFEAENRKYHVRGYVISHGFEAWIVYYGYKRAFPPSLEELTLASRAAESMVPGLDGGEDHIPLPKNTPKMAAVGK